MKNYIIKTTTGEYVLTLSVNEKNVDVFLTKLIEQIFENIPKEIAFRTMYVRRNVEKDKECVFNAIKNCVNNVGIWETNNMDMFKKMLNEIIIV